MQRLSRSPVSARHRDQNGQTVTQKTVPGQPVDTAHDWEEEKNRDKDFYDDGTMTFFW